MSTVYPHGDRSWWKKDRFGMFIHWADYAAHGRGTWSLTQLKTPLDEYEKYQEFFEPDLFDPRDWARRARRAGMKYMVITAKHHDGFCLWDSKYTTWKAKKDYLREMLDAFRAEGLRVGVYYSLLDWHHPEFTVDDNHPLRDAGKWDELNKTRDQQTYIRYIKDQVTELLTEYGKIDIIWFDYTYDRPTGKAHTAWDSAGLIKLVRSLCPDILMNDRLGLPGSGDFVSPEQYCPVNAPCDENGNMLDWEGCQTLNGGWGYKRELLSWRNSKQLIEMLIRHVSRGGNMLLNVGPDGRGRLDKMTRELLDGIAEWMELHERSIRNCTAAPAEFPEPDGCRYTYNPETNRLYVHLFSYPAKYLQLPKLRGKIRFARFLYDGAEVQMSPAVVSHTNMTEKTDSETQQLVLPLNLPEVDVPVIELMLV